MKVKNSYVKLVFWLFIGGVIGGIMGFLMMWYQSDMQRSILQNIMDFIIYYNIYIQAGVWLIIMGMALLLCIRIKRWIPHYNEEEDSTDELVDKAQSVVLLFIGVNMAMQFILFGIGIDKRNPYLLVSTLFFILFGASSSFFEVALIRQIKRLNPMKKGDPADFSFAKSWEESSDEAERLAMYRSSYKTLLLMKKVLLIGEALAIICKLQWNTGDLPIVMLGGLWLIMSVSHTIYSMKEGRGKGTIEI